MIRNNQHKYSISAMCEVLQLPRSTYYYEVKERSSVDEVNSDIIEIFQNSRQNYGTRKIKVELKKRGLVVSRRRIGRIMKEQGLVSTYTVAQFKPHSKTYNESNQVNELDRGFNQEKELHAIVSI
ncbi:transposase InsO family protein [Peribacillus sp. V2I11]|nr:transposase InsO family protein [Peribacillus sp. V2I11]